MRVAAISDLHNTYIPLPSHQIFLEYLFSFYDYVDSHKNKCWQAYAAAVAAAYAKELLNIIPGIQVIDTRRAAETISDAGSFEKGDQKVNSIFSRRGIQKRKRDTGDSDKRKRTKQHPANPNGTIRILRPPSDLYFFIHLLRDLAYPISRC
jgi:hypothetical protein